MGAVAYQLQEEDMTSDNNDQSVRDLVLFGTQACVLAVMVLTHVKSTEPQFKAMKATALKVLERYEIEMEINDVSSGCTGTDPQREPEPYEEGSL